MPQKDFSIGEAVRFGWTTARNNLGFFLVVLVIVGLIESVPEILRRGGGEGAPGLSAFTGLAFAVIQTVVGMGLVKISLRFVDNQKPELGDLFSQFSLFFPYFFAGIVYALIIAGGLILLVVPGIIWAIQFSYVFNVVIDKGYRPVEALRLSSTITRGVKWRLFLFGLVLAGINILGALALIIGLLWTIPTTLVAGTYVYRQLLAQTEPALTAAPPSLASA